MSSKITSEHLCRGAAVYIRQSTAAQVKDNTESQRRQYGLVETARDLGFASVTVIDDDLGRSCSGASDRLGFQKLAAAAPGRCAPRGGNFALETGAFPPPFLRYRSNKPPTDSSAAFAFPADRIARTPVLRRSQRRDRETTPSQRDRLRCTPMPTFETRF
jgi:hypothetical protein